MAAIGFEDLYHKLRPRLEHLERDRTAARAYARQVVTRLAFVSGGLIVVAVTAAALAGPPPFAFLFGLAGWAVLAGIIYSLTAGKRLGEYRHRFKSLIIKAMLEEMAPGMRYRGNQGVHRQTFDAAGLFSRRSDRYFCEDGFQGRVGQTDVVFSEVRAQYRSTTRDSKGRTRTSYHTFFDGLFMIADFHKDFRSPVVVLPDVAERAFGFLGKALQGFRPFSREELIYLEDPEFEKSFVVYGVDQVEARYILSTAMLRRILDLKAKWGAEVRLAFRDSRVIIAISHPANLFEPALNRPALDQGTLRRLYTELGSCLDIVEDLNLNTRVWTKK